MGDFGPPFIMPRKYKFTCAKCGDERVLKKINKCPKCGGCCFSIKTYKPHKENPT